MSASTGGFSGHLALYLLGPPRFERDGVPIRIARRKAIALLAYLTVTGESQRRDSLVNLLWPESDGTRGRAALRRTLFALRQALPGDWLIVDRDEIGLNPKADIGLDVGRFRQNLAKCENHEHPPSTMCATCAPLLTEAVDLFQGDFLTGFSLKDSFNFDDWQLSQAEALRRELVEALRKLAHWHSTQREFEPALAYARRMLALDPLDEPAHRQLMRLYTWSGHRSDALGQYRECVALLQEHLGVQPQETTKELYQKIQQGHPPPLPEADSDLQAPVLQDSPLDLDAPLPPSLERAQTIDRPVFVAREQELAQLEGYLDAALAGQGRVVFVTGEAGSGKTALIQEFTRRALSHPDLIVAGGNCNAYSGIGDPYLPFREVLGLLTGDVRAQLAAGAMTTQQARRLWHLVPVAAQAVLQAGPDLIDTFIPGPALAGRLEACTQSPTGAVWPALLDRQVDPQPPQSSGNLASGPALLAHLQSHLFEQYTKVLHTLARQVSLVLVLDDLQWADLGSINLLFHLGRCLSGNQILMVGAYRPEEVALGRPDLSGSSGRRQRHPLEPVVNEFQRSFGGITVDLGRAGGRDFVEAILDTEPSQLGSAFREKLYRQTHGHPLFTLELLRGMQDRGDLVRNRQNQWTEGAALDWESLPARVEAAISERIDRLVPPLRKALRVASVEGVDFTAEIIANVLETNRRDLVQRLSSELDRRHRLVRAHAIERLGKQRLSRYRFRHSLFQQYLYDNLDQVERAYLHEDVGTALEDLYRDRTSAIAVELARHFQEAGIAEKAVHYLRQAGERAVRLSAYDEARAHLTRGMALLVELPDSPDRDQYELALQLNLGMAWMAYGSPAPETQDSLNRAYELCQEMGKTAQLCQVLNQMSILYYVRADYARARQLGEKALGQAERDGAPLLVAVGHWSLGFILFAMGDYSAAQDHLLQIISSYDPQQHHQPLLSVCPTDAGLSALAYHACCLWCLGYPDQALERRREALTLARELAHPLSLADVLCYGGCMIDEMRRDAQSLKDSADELLLLSQKHGLSGWMAEAVGFRGKALTMLKQMGDGLDQMPQSAETIEQMQQSMATNRSRGAWCYMPVALCSLAEAHARAGDCHKALAYLDEALALVARTGEHHWEAELCRLKGETLLLQGHEADAEAYYFRAIKVAQQQQARSWELRAATSLSRLWHAQGSPEGREQAIDLLAEVYGWFTEGFETADLKEAKALLQELS